MRTPFLVVALLLPLAVPPAQSQEDGAPVLEITDPSGDVAVGAGGQTSPGLPDAGHLPNMDLVRVRVLDPDEEFLRVEFEVKAPFHRPGGSLNGVALHRYLHQLFLKIPGQGGLKVPAVLELDSYVIASQNGQPSDLRPILGGARLCILGSPRQEVCDFLDSRHAMVTIVDGRAVVELPKVFLLRLDEVRVTSRSAGLPLRLAAGNEFVDVYARTLDGASDGQFIPAAAYLTDRAPNTGLQSFALRHASPTRDLRIGALPRGVLAGEENRLPLSITNLATNKRIVNLSIEPLRTSDDGPWDIQVTPTVTLGAGKGTNVTVRVKPPVPGPDLRATVFFRIRANVLTEPGTVAIGYGGLSVQPPLDRATSTFYLHGSNYHYFTDSVPLFTSGFGALSRHEDDPLYKDAPMQMRAGTIGGPSAYIVRSFAAEAIPNPARFRAGEPIKAHLEFQADAPVTGSLQVSMRMGDVTLGEVRASVALSAGRSVVELDSAPLVPDGRLDPANGTLYAHMQLRLDPPHGVVSDAGRLHLLPKVSWFKLPVEREQAIVPAESRFKVSLEGTEELTGFVNPGRTTVYELDLRNEDEARLRLRLDLDNATEGWQYAIRPATQVSLRADDWVHVGVVVTAPAAAKEGTVSAVRLVAREAETEDLVAGQWIRTVVTSGLEIENETFKEDPADLDKVEVVRTGSSPGVTVAALLLALAAVAVIVRRR